jgi:hypothetical protein
MYGESPHLLQEEDSPLETGGKTHKGILLTGFTTTEFVFSFFKKLSSLFQH